MTQDYDDVTSSVLEAVPSDGWIFTGWSGAATGTDNPVTVTVDCALNVTANFAPAAGSKTVYLPHISGPVAGWIDYLQADNLGMTSASYTLTLYGAGGVQIYSGVQAVPARSKVALQIKNLQPGTTENALAGKITYEDSGLNFRLSQHYTTGGGVAQFGLTDTLSSKLGFFFSDFMPTLNTKGLALTNFGATAVTVTLEAVGNGSVTPASTTVTINPNEKFIKTYEDLFNLSVSDVQVITASTSSPTLAGVVVTSESDLGFLLFTVAAPIE